LPEVANIDFFDPIEADFCGLKAGGRIAHFTLFYQYETSAKLF
jgi:hypothetical protein